MSRAAHGNTEVPAGPRWQFFASSQPLVWGWHVSVWLIVAVLLAPLAALLVIAGGADQNVWPHLLSTVLPGSILTTLELMAGVGIVTTVIGAGTAWIVTMNRFWGRRVFAWLLVVPLAMPTYLIALSYLELWDYSGWIQTGLRDLFGWRDARDYWFPEIRSLGGAIILMSFVLYPYVYLTARASFIQQSAGVLEVSRTLGRTAFGAFWAVGLPLARPAIIAGVTLALMECLNDIGAVEHLGVNTLTLSVYSTWLERGSLPGAAQIACVMLVFVLALSAVERWSRRQRTFEHGTQRFDRLPVTRLTGWRALAAIAACSLPVLIGFVLPAIVLVEASLDYWREALSGAFWQHVRHSVTIAAFTAVIAVLLAVFVVFVRRLSNAPAVVAAMRLTALGYAVPGTVLAIGVIGAVSAFDRSVGSLAATLSGPATGAIVSGTIGAVVYACLVRFMAVAQGGIESGFQRISNNVDYAARSLGRRPREVLAQIHLPLLRPALGAAALLVFVDTMKELPATLLLRPFNFDTLATHVYTQASLDLFEESAPAALAIVVAGLAPLLILNRIVARGRPSSKRMGTANRS